MSLSNGLFILGAGLLWVALLVLTTNLVNFGLNKVGATDAEVEMYSGLVILLYAGTSLIILSLYV